MANDLNQCNFIGHLGKDPEVRYSSAGNAIANFSIACGWKTKEKEGTEWVSITAFGKLGEICGQYLKKGSQVYVSGRFTTEKYTDKQGIEKYSTKIIAEQMQMLGSKQGSTSAPSESDFATNSAPSKSAPNFSDMDSDIPF